MKPPPLLNLPLLLYLPTPVSWAGPLLPGCHWSLSNSKWWASSSPRLDPFSLLGRHFSQVDSSRTMDLETPLLKALKCYLQPSLFLSFISPTVDRYVRCNRTKTEFRCSSPSGFPIQEVLPTSTKTRKPKT